MIIYKYYFHQQRYMMKHALILKSFKYLFENRLIDVLLANTLCKLHWTIMQISHLLMILDTGTIKIAYR